eukprot:GHVS01072922.1.p1 GENE.GHVS01072922.1~~GHVS01072922.1.p1  ORF type:complete len:612 (+),score=103.78 GHVS01072922.1:217-2052(+)
MSSSGSSTSSSSSGGCGGGSSHDLVVGCVGKPSSGKSTFFNAVTTSLQLVSLLQQNQKEPNPSSVPSASSAYKSGGTAKVGNYPFTTIDPNEGIAYYPISCACSRDYSDTHPHVQKIQCQPHYGCCVNGQRWVPIKLLDVAGLIPGASEGRGLGNKFLDDLRHAHVLLHIIDISGNTNEKGEQTVGYDPGGDHEWLVEEIEQWLFGNLWGRWSTIVRKYAAALQFGTEGGGGCGGGGNAGRRGLLVSLLQSQLSGYGANEQMISQLVDVLAGGSEAATEGGTNCCGDNNSGGCSGGGGRGRTFRSSLCARLGEDGDSWMDVQLWEKDDIQRLVKEFVKFRFPFVLVLNKIDSAGSEPSQTGPPSGTSSGGRQTGVAHTDKNAMAISSKYDDVVLCSALAECFLNKMALQKYIKYTPGDMFFDTADDFSDTNTSPGATSTGRSADGVGGCKPLDDKMRHRLQSIRDLVIYRHGATGVHAALGKAVALADRIPVYPVRNIKHLGGRRRKVGKEEGGKVGKEGGQKRKEGKREDREEDDEVDGGGSGASCDVVNAFPECVLIKRGRTVREFARSLHNEIDKHYLGAEGVDGRRLGESEVIVANKNDIICYVTSF